MDFTPGTLIGSYRLEGVRGRGGMGVVYEATHTRLGVRRALKLIAHALADDPGFRARFERESQVAASIEHPNVITIHDSGEWEGVLYIAMQYVEGTDLRELVSRTGRVEPRRAANILSQVASALDAAHERGLVHRDVKPANVLVVDEGTRDHALLTDFGLTKSTTSAAGITQTGQWVGTLDFIAPEQLDGRPVDARTDVYALGAVLYHALSGEVPYPRESDMGKLYAHVHEPPPRLTPGSVPAEVAPGLQEVVSRAMAKNPDERYRSAGELGRAALAAADLSAAPTHAAIGHPVAPSTGRTLPGQPPPPPPPTGQTLPGQYPPPVAAPSTYPLRHGDATVTNRRRRRWIVGAAAAMVLALTAATAALVVGSSNDGGAPERTEKSRAEPARPAVRSRDNSFAVELPRGWSSEKPKSGDDLLLFGPSRDPDLTDANVIVSHEPAGGKSLDEYTALTLKLLEDDGFKLDRGGAESTTVDGVPASRYTYSLIESSRGKSDARGRQFVIVRGDRAYYVTYTTNGETFNEYVGEFEQIMNSWRWR